MWLLKATFHRMYINIYIGTLIGYKTWLAYNNNIKKCKSEMAWN